MLLSFKMQATKIRKGTEWMIAKCYDWTAAVSEGAGLTEFVQRGLM